MLSKSSYASLFVILAFAIALNGCTTSAPELAAAIHDRQVDNVCRKPKWVFPDAWDKTPRITPEGHVWMIHCVENGAR